MKYLIACIMLTYASPSFPQDRLTVNHRLLYKELEKLGWMTSNELINIDSMMSVGKDCDGEAFCFKPKQKLQNLSLIIVGRAPISHHSIKRSIDVEEESEYFDYFMFLDEEFKIVKIRIFNYQSMHGQGITAKTWLAQFEGYDAKTFSENAKNIDAISGATLSVNTLMNTIRCRMEDIYFFKESK